MGVRSCNAAGSLQNYSLIMACLVYIFLPVSLLPEITCSSCLYCPVSICDRSLPRLPRTMACITDLSFTTKNAVYASLPKTRDTFLNSGNYLSLVLMLNSLVGKELIWPKYLFPNIMLVRSQFSSVFRNTECFLCDIHMLLEQFFFRNNVLC